MDEPYGHISEVYRLMLDGAEADALIQARMLAQEILSDATSAWRREESADTATTLLEASTAYAETLMRGGDPASAFAACLTAIAYTAKAATPPEPALAAFLSAWAAFQAILAAAEPPSPQMATLVQPHTEAVTASIGQEIYRLYYELGSMNPQSPLMDDAYMALRQISSLVALEPASDNRLHSIASILSHSQALALI